VPVIDVRIWVSQTTYNNYYGGALAPKYFNFNASYSSTSGSYGYASIVRPVASAAAGLFSNTLYLYGGDIAASNYPTAFGGSQGLSWNWTGPGSFASGVENPITDRSGEFIP
jgi:hypothetical protein